MPNLVQRLRDFRTWNNRNSCYEPVPICKEAAIEIQSLKEQIEALNDAIVEGGNKAWDAINALGGADAQDNSYDQGIVDTVRKALDLIEALGGTDPKQRTAQVAAVQHT